MTTKSTRSSFSFIPYTFAIGIDPYLLYTRSLTSKEDQECTHHLEHPLGNAGVKVYIEIIPLKGAEKSLMSR